VCADREGNIWAGTDSGGLDCLQPRRVVNYTTKDGLLCDDVWSISKAHDGSLWIGAAGRVSHFVNNHFLNYSVTTPNGGDACVGRPISVVQEDAQGAVWAGGLQGIARFDGKRFVLAGRAVVQPFTGLLASAYLDPQGTFWCVGNDVACQCRNGHWQIEAAVSGAPAPNLVGVLKDAVADVWFWLNGYQGIHRIRKPGQGTQVIVTVPLGKQR
jgi:ligand-binding sensor domain-containing protein